MAMVLFLGVMIALSIMSVAIVTLVANAQHSTTREKSRASAFDVAEAAIDVSMQLLAQEWPNTEAKAWSDDEFLTGAPEFATHFGVTPGIAQDNSVRVLLSNDSGDPATAPRWDSDGNGYLWLDAQARVHGVSSRIRAMVQADFYSFGLAKGIVVFAGGTIDVNGLDQNKPVIGAQDVTVGGPQPVSMVIRDPNHVGWNPVVAWPYVDQDPPYMPTRKELMSDQTISDLKLLAKTQDPSKYFTTAPATSAGWQGLCVIEAPSGTTVAMPQGVYNSIEHPGILLVLGGAQLKISGNMQYYGVIYCAGTLSFSSGNPIIYGMVIAETNMNVSGAPQIIYREDCLTRLDTQVQTDTRLVPNYWRELTPVVPTPASP